MMRLGFHFGSLVLVSSLLLACGSNETTSADPTPVPQGTAGDSGDDGAYEGDDSGDAQNPYSAVTDNPEADGDGGAGGAGGAEDTPICEDSGVLGNNDQGAAYDLGSIADNDENQTSISGVLAGEEEDWFRFLGEDKGAVVDPEVTLSTSAEGAYVCAYIYCESGDLKKLECPEEAWSDGAEGCCSETGFHIKSGQFNCKSLDDSAIVYLAVGSASDEASCSGYSMTVHY